MVPAPVAATLTEFPSLYGVGQWDAFEERAIGEREEIDDHIAYLMVRVDPDKVTPLKDEAASKADLSGGSGAR